MNTGQLALLGAAAIAAGAPASNTVEQARYKLGVPKDYGLTAEQQKAFNPVIRQCGSDLATMRGFRKDDNWYDWGPITDPARRSEMRAICAAYHVGLADGIAIGDAAARRESSDERK